jgi:hypothetical protein
MSFQDSRRQPNQPLVYELVSFTVPVSLLHFIRFFLIYVPDFKDEFIRRIVYNE